MTKRLQATAIVARNSLDFVAHAFESGDVHRTLVTVKDAHQVAELQGIEVDRILETTQRHGWYSRQRTLSSDDLPAQVTSTSGTEGKPKAIVLSFANLADTAHRIINAMHMTGDIREYVGVPVTYSFGMGRFRAISAVGGSAYLSSRGFDPLELVRMLKAGEINALSAVPTLLRVLLASPDVIGTAGKNLRWMEIGSQYMSAAEKRRVCELFPNARIVQHYGLTEASRSTFLDVSGATDMQLESVGRPEGNVQVGINDQGRIRVRGPHVARWRVDGEGLHELCDADGWLQTNDLGHLRDGDLYFDGRADDLINCGGIKIVPEVLEEKIRARLGACPRIAVARVHDESRGDGVLAVIEGESDDEARLKQAATAAMSELGAEAAGSLHVRNVKAIPFTATGKPRRRELAADFDATHAGAPVHTDTTPQTGQIRDVCAVFQHVFPGVEVKPGDSFESLGGDSLRYIQFSMHFERLFGPLPDQWQGLSVTQLQARVKPAVRSSWRSLEPGTLMRAVAMTFIVARHSHAFTYSRNFGAGVLLFALGGYALARFQLPEIIRKASVRSVVATALLVAIPTILATIPLQVLSHGFVPTQYLLINNFFDPMDPSRRNGAQFYFAEIYIQLFLLAALLFSFRRVRSLFRDHPMASAMGLFTAALGFKYAMDTLWDTHYLFQRVPQNYAWCFSLGIVVGVARTMPQRLIALGLVATSGYLFWGLETSAYLVVGGLAAVLFIQSVRVPATLKTVVGEVAAASMFIYVAHELTIHVVTKFLGAPHPWIGLFAAIPAGIGFAYAYNLSQRRLSQTRMGRRFFGLLAPGQERRIG